MSFSSSKRRPVGLWIFAVMLLMGASLAVAQSGEAAEAALSDQPAAFAEEELDAPLATEYWRASADTFVPYNSTLTWAYWGAGCVYRTGGTSWSDIDLQLPDGVTITFLRVYFNDSDAANNAAATLFSFDGAGNFTQLATVASAGTPGQSSAGVSLSHLVNTTNEALGVRLGFGTATTSSLALCGVRIQYSTP